MRVFKYPAQLGLFRSLMPRSAEVLHFGHAGEGFAIWAITSPREAHYTKYADALDRLDAPELRYFYLAATGEELPPYATKETYIGTAKLDSFVAHLFEVPA
jgi:hypothetical protein